MSQTVVAPVRFASILEPGDDELMEFVRAGDPRAFDLLVRRHQQRVLRLASRYLRDKSWARDVSQNAFLELYRARMRYQSRGKFTPYLKRIVLNQCRMHARGQVLHDPPKFEAVLAAGTAADPYMQRVLELALSELSEKLRSVVILRHLEQLTLAEAAERLALPIGTVKSRLFEAHARLREIVAELA